jgi:hypothetical protein
MQGLGQNARFEQYSRSPVSVGYVRGPTLSDEGVVSKDRLDITVLPDEVSPKKEGPANKCGAYFPHTKLLGPTGST